MRWTCPHCKRIMSTPDEELVQGWRLVRCTDCKGFSMAKKPAPARVLKSAPVHAPAPAPSPEPAQTASPRVVAARREDAVTQAPAPVTPPAFRHPRPGVPQKPKLFVAGESAPKSAIPEPLPDLEFVAPNRASRFAAPIALMALGALAIFAGIQIRETHETRMAATAANHEVRKLQARTSPPVAGSDSISVGQAAAIRSGESAQRAATGEQK